MVRGTFVGDREISTRFVHANLFDLFQYTQLLEYRQIHGQQRFADMEAWMLIGFKHRDIPAARTEQRARSGAGWAAPHHNDVALIVLNHGQRLYFNPQLRKITVCGSKRRFATASEGDGCLCQRDIQYLVEDLMEAMTPEEARLASLIVEVLNLEDIKPEDIGPTQPLFDGGLGLDSIDALEIAVAVAQTYGVHLKAEDEETRAVFRDLRSLAGYISEHPAASA